MGRTRFLASSHPPPGPLGRDSRLPKPIHTPDDVAPIFPTKARPHWSNARQLEPPSHGPINVPRETSGARPGWSRAIAARGSLFETCFERSRTEGAPPATEVLSRSTRGQAPPRFRPRPWDSSWRQARIVSPPPHDVHSHR